MIKKLITYISFLLFISLMALFILELSGRSDILSVSASKYLNFLKHGQIPIVSAVFILFSLGASSVLAFGSFRDVVALKEISTPRFSWISFLIIFAAQFVCFLMWRAK